VTFGGPPIFLIDNDLLLSVDCRVVFLSLSDPTELSVGSNIEVIPANAFEGGKMSSVLFESGTRLMVIGYGAFSGCSALTGFTVPESVEIIGDRVRSVLNLVPSWKQSSSKCPPG
jgi:hypothetical protein